MRPHSLARVQTSKKILLLDTGTDLGMAVNTVSHLSLVKMTVIKCYVYRMSQSFSGSFFKKRKKDKLFALAFQRHDRKLKIATVRCDTTHALHMNQCTFTGDPNHCQKEREVRDSAMVISAGVCDLFCNYSMFVTHKPQQPTWTLLTSELVLYPHFQNR